MVRQKTEMLFKGAKCSIFWKSLYLARSFLSDFRLGIQSNAMNVNIYFTFLYEKIYTYALCNKSPRRSHKTDSCPSPSRTAQGKEGMEL